MLPNRTSFPFLFLLIIPTILAATSPLDVLPLSVSQDDSFNFQLLLQLGNARYGAAEAAEILSAARVIQPGNFSSFNTTFYQLAIHREVEAESHNTSGDIVSARDSYFIAANYYRNADFYLHGNWSDPLINCYWSKQTDCFDKADAMLQVPGVRVTLPADGFDTIGIFFGAGPYNANCKRPTLLVGNGYDAAQEDSYHSIGRAALERGWNVMTYEGPGQPTVRRDQNIGFIPDWEKVVTPAVDYLASRSDVDMDRLALIGISMGGYLAARAAAFEPRIKAVLLQDGVFSVSEAEIGAFDSDLSALFYSGNQTAFDAAVLGSLLSVNDSSVALGASTARWGADQGMWSFNTHSPYEWLTISENMTFTRDDLPSRIKVPVWVGNGLNDTTFPGQAMKAYEALKDANVFVTLHNFTGPAAYHCQAGVPEEANRVMFTWLESVLP